MKHPADPTPRSANEVFADHNYKKVVSEPSSQQRGGHVVVVLHCGSETYWGTTYPVWAQLTMTATWQQVEPIVETHTTYRPVP